MSKQKDFISQRKNWISGQILTDKDLTIRDELTYDYVDYLFYQIMPLNYKFGLLSHKDNQQLDICITPSGAISVRNLIALTSSGKILEEKEIILNSDFEEIQSSQDTKFWLVACYKGGKENIDFKPDQKPFSPYYKSKCVLNLVPDTLWSESRLSLDVLPIAQIELRENDFMVDKNYIPPCSKIQQNKRLLSLHIEFKQVLLELFVLGKEIQLNCSDVRIDKLVMSITSFLSQNIDEYELLYVNLAPIYSFLFFKKLARSVFSTVGVLTQSKNENAFKVLEDYGQISLTKVNQHLAKIIYFQYDHHNVFPFFNEVEEMLIHLMRILKTIKDFEVYKLSNEYEKVSFVNYVKQDGHLISSKELEL